MTEIGDVTKAAGKGKRGLTEGTESERERESSGDSEPPRITCFPIQRLFLKDISKDGHAG